MLTPFSGQRWVFVDLESTGSAPQRERVTEIGIVTVDLDGDATQVTEWSSLIDPQRPIPLEIQWLTGITDDMVRGAPTFKQIAGELLDRLRDAVFIAHNARFDYGFLKAEFARLGIAWRASTLCTVRLSRLLFPDRGPHSLDAIVARFGLEGEQRHRALGDARLLWRFLQRLYQRLPPADIETAVAALLARSSTPPMLPLDAFDGIPSRPGVYRFYGLNAHPIYVGKSVDLRTRILSHFGADHASDADSRLAQQVCRIEWEETPGELGALLREAQLVKEQLPAHNVALRRQDSVVVSADAQGRLRFAKVSALDPADLPAWHGPFSSRGSARAWLSALAREHALCPQVLGLERAVRGEPGRPCFARQVNRCAGACAGAETREAHAVRLQHLLEPMRIPPWPASGPVGLLERSPHDGQECVQVFDRWCWLGTAVGVTAAQALVDARPGLRFDPDVYRIIRAALDDPVRHAGLVRPVSLHGRSPEEAGTTPSRASTSDAAPSPG